MPERTEEAPAPVVSNWKIYGAPIETVAPDGFLVEWVGRPHNRRMRPISTEPALAGSRNSRSAPEYKGGFFSSRSSLAGRLSFDTVFTQGRFSASTKNSSLVYAAWETRECVSMDPSVLVMEDLPKGTTMVPYEVCLGYQTTSVLTAKQGLLSAEVAAGVMARVEAGVDAETATTVHNVWTRGLTRQPNCHDFQFNDAGSFQKCFSAQGSAAPVVVRWVRVKPKERGGTDSAGVANADRARRARAPKVCKLFQLDTFSYNADPGLEPYIKIRLPAGRGKDIRKTGRQGQFEATRVAPGESISYTIYDEDLAFDDVVSTGSIRVPSRLNGGSFGDRNVSIQAICIKR